MNIEIQEGLLGRSSYGCSMTFTQKNEDAILDIIDVTPKNIIWNLHIFIIIFSQYV